MRRTFRPAAATIRYRFSIRPDWPGRRRERCDDQPLGVLRKTVERLVILLPEFFDGGSKRRRRGGSLFFQQRLHGRQRTQNAKPTETEFCVKTPDCTPTRWPASSSQGPPDMPIAIVAARSITSTYRSA